GQSLGAVYYPREIDPSLGGIIREFAGSAQVAIAAAAISSSAQVTINAEPVDTTGARAQALTKQNLRSLGAGRDIEFVSSGTLISASLTLPFDPTLAPTGLSPSAFHLAYFDPTSSSW